MSVLHPPHELTVTEAAQRGVAKLVADAERGCDLVVTRRHKPVAAIIGLDRLTALERAASDLHDLALATARGAEDTGERTSFADVLAAFGHSTASLAALPEDE